jgi:hypothetical protein
MSLALLVQVGGIPGAPGACSIIEDPCFRVGLTCPINPEFSRMSGGARAPESGSAIATLHLHRRMTSQQIDHHARMRRVEMLDQNEGHAAAGREHVEQAPEGIEAAGRCAEPDDREALCRGGEPRRGAERRFGGRAVPACRGPCRAMWRNLPRSSVSPRP